MPDCFRLAYQGGPLKEPNRGMTLGLKTSFLDNVMSQLTDVQNLLLAQKALVARSFKVYGPNSIGYHQDLAILHKLQTILELTNELSQKEIAILVIATLIEFEAGDLVDLDSNWKNAEKPIFAKLVELATNAALPPPKLESTPEPGPIVTGTSYTEIPDDMRKDAKRYRWLKENNAWIRPCETQRCGHRSTATDSQRECWLEFEGWLASTMPIHQDAYPSMDAAVDAAMALLPK